MASAYGRLAACQGEGTRSESREMPAMPPLWLFALIGRVVQRWRERRAIKALLKRDDHILCDLGHSRARLRQRLHERGPHDARLRDHAARSGP